ncbi:HoxN/HupN/NixA family nickel/cobalt transporter [Nocardioides KLBMP 9356]|uniref:Nickel/cobalt efflux system n=1 Tax=Nocardioides potassii TaxID=2911371 RepID=A0ABS9H9R6_9ACTN|nr:HoxN/HupN/NixA family nickel/cobalt transporter [Nocardioides potassii]MCF6376851.1 HoxN/HupN/NixA family nickel/cobalt transporter [Nocardioides potassii]
MNNPLRSFTALDRRHILGMGAVVVLLNVVGWGVLVLAVAPQRFDVGSAGVFGIGLGVAAFLLGARHAFDADHIAAIDNTTRKLVGDGSPATTTGFWFGMGHSSVVFGLSLLLAIGVRALADPVKDDGSVLQGTLGTIGTLTAGTFLIVIGLMNLSALVGIVHAYRHLRAGTFDEEHLEHHLHNRGFLARIFRRSTQKVTRARHLYPVGLLMGLGFDTATQVALLVLAGGTAAFALPWYAILTLPVLFAAGMVLFDSLDGILMTRAYSWAFLKPIRKIYYNLTVTVLSVTVALSIGLLLLVQLASEWVPGLAWAGSLDLEYVGFGLVALFLLVWAASVAWYHLGRVEEKFEKGIA